jgi:hypothetical protein
MISSEKNKVCRRTAGYRGLVLAAFCCAAIVPGCSCHRRPKPPPPPDLSRCTRIEISYEHSAMDVVQAFGENLLVLSPQETQYLKSLREVSVRDSTSIRTLGGRIARATYVGPDPGVMALLPVTAISGYVGDRKVASFRMQYKHLYDKGHVFELGEALDVRCLASEVRPFVLRRECAQRLAALHGVLEHRLGRKKTAAAPIPSNWCDYLGLSLQDDNLRCPVAGDDGPCHYALNASWEPNAPPDTVLLFETQAGWNQRGGPELFAFDHHDPEGGCVLLYGGTVQFIRTKEDLAQLRWKP